MEPRKLEPGDVVQVDPDASRSKAFAGCLLVVSEVTTFGCIGYVQGPGATRDMRGEQTYYPTAWDEMEFVGHAIWTVS